MRVSYAPYGQSPNGASYRVTAGNSLELWTLRFVVGILVVWSPRSRGFAALGQERRWDVGDTSEGRLFGRKRRKNADAARVKSYRVYVTAEEDVQLRARAVVRDVTVPRLLFEAAMSGHVETDTDRKAAIVEIFAVRKLLANIANNANQLARFANSEGIFPTEAETILTEYRVLVPRLSAAIDRLADS